MNKQEVFDLQNLESVFQTSPMPIAIYLGEEMRIHMANDAMLNIWGRDTSVIGKKLKEALPELEGQGFHGLLKTVYETGESYHAKEDRADLIVDGRLQTFYFTFSYKALRNSSGEIFGIINTAADVTELVLTKRRTLEIEERLSFALSAADAGTWDLDPINNKVNWDERCRELFGFSGVEDVSYDDVLNHIDPQDIKRVQDAVSKALKYGESYVYDIRYRTIDRSMGLSRWLHCRGKAYFNEQGIPYRFAGTAHDITNEVKARIREEQLLSLVNNNADMMSIADLEGNCLYMNDAGRDLLGVPRDMDITRLKAEDFYTPEELARVQTEIVPNIDKEKGWNGVIMLNNFSTGEEIPCTVNYILIADPVTGEVYARGATARDRRPQIKARIELQRLAKIVDKGEDFSNYCDINGNTLYISPAGIKMIGLNPERTTQTTLFDYHSLETNLRFKDEIFPLILKEGKWSGKLELRHQKTGEIIPIYKQFYLIQEDVRGTAVAIAGIARDLRPELNARRQLDLKNEELQEAVRELEFLANTVPSLVWSSKPDGELDFINLRWQEEIFQSVNESLGTKWLDIVHADDKEEVERDWQLSIKEGKPFQNEFRLLNKDGNYRWYLTRAQPLRNEHGEIIKWYGINIDVQEKKEMEYQKDSFLGIASHELKTPVTSIKAYAQVMERQFLKKGDEKNASMINRLDRQVDRLNSLIGDLLDVTKINTGRLEFNNKEFDFDEMVAEIAEDVQRTTSKHHIRVTLNFKQKYFGDRERVSQVIINLLTNAIKYSPNAQEVIVGTTDLGRYLLVSVQDFGIGISAEKKEKVFEQFYRVSGSKQYTFSGLGLGLYISSQIVKRLNGKIWVNSEEGKGSIFYFSLPIESHHLPIAL